MADQPTPAAERQLPDKLSDLIDVAIDDCEAIAKDERYALNMFEWHTPAEYAVGADGRDSDDMEDTRCHVCMAGAVMARRLGVEFGSNAGPGIFDDELELKLETIDLVRTGSVGAALAHMGATESEINGQAAHLAHDVIFKGFDNTVCRSPWSAYREAARILREAGL